MNPNEQQAGAPKEDFVDKGLDKLERSRGMDPAQKRGMNEKITDKGREIFEKATGKHVPDKVSN